MMTLRARAAEQRQAGFSLIELLVVIAILGIAAAMALFQVQPALNSYRLNTAAQTIGAQTRQAQQAAIAGFTHAQLSVDTTAMSFGVQRLDRTAATPTFVAAGPVLVLPSKVRFGFGGATSPPPRLGTTLAQSTTFLVNSQGRPIDAAGLPTGAYVVYVTNGVDTYAVNVTITGRVVIWRSSGGSWTAL